PYVSELRDQRHILLAWLPELDDEVGLEDANAIRVIPLVVADRHVVRPAPRNEFVRFAQQVDGIKTREIRQRSRPHHSDLRIDRRILSQQQAESGHPKQRSTGEVSLQPTVEAAGAEA